MAQSVFFEMEFLLLVICSLVLPVGVYAFLFNRASISRLTVLCFSVLMIVVSGADIVLLQILAAKAKITVSSVDDAIFSTQLSIALYLLPAMFAGLGINLASHVLINHLNLAEAKFERDERARDTLHVAETMLQSVKKHGFSNGPVLFVSCTVMIAAIFFGDLMTTSDIRLHVLYVFPLALITRYCAPQIFAIVAFVVVTLLQAITFSFHTTTVPSFVTDFFVAIGASLLVLYMARTTRTHYLATATLAATDPLTNLANRRAFVAALESEIARQQRYGGVVSLAILDLDEFKMLNDSKGHYAGDEALKIAAALLRSETRKSDLVARIGGDEFAILMPNTFDFERMLQQLCSRIAEDMSAASFPVTASIGCKTFGTPPQDASEAMRQVDALMYEAKSRGRNCVVWSPQLIG